MDETRRQDFRDDIDTTMTVINVFTPKPGRLDDFVEAQEAGLPRFRGKVPGLRGGRFYRALDGKTAVLISVFETQDHFERFRNSALFAAYREKILPLLERTEPGLYSLVYETEGCELPAGE